MCNASKKLLAETKTSILKWLSQRFWLTSELSWTVIVQKWIRNDFWTSINPTKVLRENKNGQCWQKKRKIEVAQEFWKIVATFSCSDSETTSRNDKSYL